MEDAKSRLCRCGESRRGKVCFAVLWTVLTVLFPFSFILGRYDVPFKEVVHILLSRWFPITPTWTPNMETVVLNIRLPRILLACLVGACLSAAGATYQSVFQNPMAAPDILGASSGACFGAALAILLGLGSYYITVFAFVFSLTTVGMVCLVGRQVRGNPITGMLLAGIMVSSLFNAGTSYLKLVADPTNELPAITYWLMGSLSGAKMRDVGLTIVPMLIGMVPLLLLRWRINVLTLEEDEAHAIGVDTRRLRLAVIICATVITAASVAASGMIGWVGLVIPHLCRRLVGNNFCLLLPCSILFGAIFLLVADNISRNLLATEIPIGILTAFVGAPFLLYLLTRKEHAL